ncbi:MAG TPA: GNAT family N-acetyltransferase [Labilithrix sp.]|nr:GNAT family N-acetyltransferase [Labilithrix sp.]
MHSVHVRPALLRDVPRLVELNKAAYPDLVEEGVVFDAAQLMAQQAVFPEGQVVVEQSGLVVGSIATLIVSTSAASAPHTWSGITSYGTFAGHDRNGDVLYLADVYIDPAVRGMGIGSVLYDALFRLCERRRLARVVAGGRLWGYHEVAHRMSPAEYVDEVVRGARKDRVLTSQLRAGFTVAGILEGYLTDWRSAGYATHLFWENTLSKARGAMPSAQTTSRKPAMYVEGDRRSRTSSNSED